MNKAVETYYSSKEKNFLKRYYFYRAYYYFFFKKKRFNKRKKLQKKWKLHRTFNFVKRQELNTNIFTLKQLKHNKVVLKKFIAQMYNLKGISMFQSKKKSYKLQNCLVNINSRLDTILLGLNLIKRNNLYLVQKLISKGDIFVEGKKVSNVNFKLKPNSIISFNPFLHKVIKKNINLNFKQSGLLYNPKILALYFWNPPINGIALTGLVENKITKIQDNKNLFYFYNFKKFMKKKSPFFKKTNIFVSFYSQKYKLICRKNLLNLNNIKELI
jgi:ribosomal protein S4